jgi:hypothetical protein
VSEVREVGRFDAIEVSGSFDVEVQVGESREVVVHADDNLLDHVRTEVDDGVLELRTKRSIRPTRTILVRIGVPDLDAVSLGGSGDVDVRGVETRRFEVSLAGSGDIRVTGVADAAAVSLAGSGDVDLGRLSADRVEVSIAGSGDVAVRAADHLEVSIAGSGDVSYRGQPRVSVSRSGSGEVYARD